MDITLSNLNKPGNPSLKSTTSTNINEVNHLSVPPCIETDDHIPYTMVRGVHAVRMVPSLSSVALTEGRLVTIPACPTFTADVTNHSDYDGLRNRHIDGIEGIPLGYTEEYVNGYTATDLRIYSTKSTPQLLTLLIHRHGQVTSEGHHLEDNRHTRPTKTGIPVTSSHLVSLLCLCLLAFILNPCPLLNTSHLVCLSLYYS